MNRWDVRSVLAGLRPERRRLVLAVVPGLLLAVILAGVVAAPEVGLTLVAMTLGMLFLGARPHWGVLAIFVLVVFRVNPAVVGQLGTAELLAAPLIFPLARELVRDRGGWTSLAPQIRLLLGVGGVLLAATVWSLVTHPAPPLAEQDEGWSVLISFGEELLFLIYLVYFIKTPRHLVYAVVIVLLMIVAAALDSLDLFGAGHGAGRARVSQGWAANSNRLAFLCVWGTALAWSLRFKGPPGWWRPLMLAPLVGLPITTLMTGSRNGLLQLTLLGGLIVLEQRQWPPAQRARAFALMVVVAVMVFALAPSAMVERASQFEGPSVNARLNTHWASAVMLVEHPLFGVGPGNFEWRNQAMTGETMGTHDSYLWALMAGGPLLLLLYLAIFRRTHQMLRAVERWGSSEFVWLATALRFNLIILLGFSFFADLWLTPPFYLLLGLTIALSRIATADVPAITAVPARVRVVTA
jgi:hypothetical protein